MPLALTLPAALASRGFHVRPAEPADRAFERALFATARIDRAFLSGWPKETLEPFLDQQFQFQTVHYARAYPQADRLIVVAQTQAIGRLVLDRGGPEWVLVDIALLPDWRGQGLGEALIGGIQQLAAESGAAVLLSVDMSSRARLLYERLGFRAIDGSSPNVAMQWTLRVS